MLQSRESRLPALLQPLLVQVKVALQFSADAAADEAGMTAEAAASAVAAAAPVVALPLTTHRPIRHQARRDLDLQLLEAEEFWLYDSNLSKAKEVGCDGRAALHAPGLARSQPTPAALPERNAACANQAKRTPLPAFLICLPVLSPV